MLISPTGPLIVDDAGEPVWIQPFPHATANFAVQTYQGRPVLTWWEGEITDYGVGQHGECVITDSSYREIKRLSGGNGLVADLHDFVITPRDTTYLTAYRSVPADLRAVHGPANGMLLDAVVQEIDLATDNVMFEWHRADHVAPTETYQKYSTRVSFDPVHINSIDLTADGNLLLSARNTWTV